MSYDGGLKIKIKNKKLGEVLDDFSKKGYFPEECVPSWRNQPEEDDYGDVINPRVKYTLFYSYMDCAYVEGCPKSIDEVGKYITRLIEFYEDGIKRDQLKEVEKRICEEDVINDYKLVCWEFYSPGDGELEEFSYKK